MSQRVGDRMKCGFCGYEFDAAEGQATCGGCPLAGQCTLVRCPRCGYDNPAEAQLVGLVRRLRQKLRRPSSEEHVSWS